MFSLPDYRSSLDVYDTTLPTNSLLAKSIQILTVASRFLTARPALDTYLSNMSIGRAEVYAFQRQTNPHALYPALVAIVHILIKLQPASQRHTETEGRGFVVLSFAAIAGAFTDYDTWRASHS